ncbi:sensor histidine kinase [Tellurirhabdus bombi]|uniref:sensor histidine kinase n=1 Tax=Tellurirhabdus bombi TaxID=2907205 RepID=UPI001F233859|nr:HAMP domain-containing sensor histidine kinase [Tellurirhabdus bombi]
MSRRLIRILVVLSVLSIIGILTVQIVWVTQAYRLGERQFRQTAFIALQDVAEQVAQLNKVTLRCDAVSQISSNYFVVNTESPVDPTILEHFITQSLRQHNLITDFEYGVYSCESDRMVYGNYVSTQASLTAVQPTRQFPTLPQFTYHFGIRFPNQTGFLTSQLDNYIASSVAVLVVVLFFGYTLFVVLRQRRLTEVQQDFINNITHELQTPISTIRIAADVLRSDTITEQPERLRQYTRILQEESVRLQNQVQDVLQLARSERLRFALDRQELDLHEVLKTLAALYQPHVSLDLKAAQSVIKADRYHLENLVKNLLDNAVKYCTDAPCVTIQTRNEGAQVIWSVRDNGIGIAQEYHEKIFGQFYRVPTDRMHTVKGFGIGLYYVRKVIRAHRWQIRLQSAEGAGSEFVIIST